MTRFKKGDRVKVVSTHHTLDTHDYDPSTMQKVGEEFVVSNVGENAYAPYVADDSADGWYWHPADLELVTEPAPLKEGDAVLVWATVCDTGFSGEVDVQFSRIDDTTESHLVRHDAVVRPADGQVPPWNAKPAEPAGRGAVAVDAGDVLWLRLRFAGEAGERWVTTANGSQTLAHWGDLDIPADGVKWEGMQ